METLETYLRQNADRIEQITDPDRQIFPVSGLTAADSLLESYEDKTFPVLLTEEIDEGYFAFEQGFTEHTVKNLWVMIRVPNPELTEERKEAMKKCMELGVHILKMLTADYYDSELAEAWNRKRTSFIPMQNIGHCFGYTFTLAFVRAVDFVLDNE